MNKTEEARFLALPPALLFLSPRRNEWYIAGGVPQYDVPEDPALANVQECCE